MGAPAVFGNETEEEMVAAFLEARKEGNIEEASYYLHPSSLSLFRKILTAAHGKIAEKVPDPEMLWQATGFEVIPVEKELSNARFFQLCVENLAEEEKEKVRDWELMAVAEGKTGERYAVLKAENEVFDVTTIATRTWTIRYQEHEPKLSNAFYNIEVAQAWFRKAHELTGAWESAEESDEEEK